MRQWIFHTTLWQGEWVTLSNLFSCIRNKGVVLGRWNRSHSWRKSSFGLEKRWNKKKRPLEILSYFKFAQLFVYLPQTTHVIRRRDWIRSTAVAQKSRVETKTNRVVLEGKSISGGSREGKELMKNNILKSFGKVQHNSCRKRKGKNRGYLVIFGNDQNENLLKEGTSFIFFLSVCAV